jgi:hypothetical protein
MDGKGWIEEGGVINEENEKYTKMRILKECSSGGSERGKIEDEE